MKKIILAIAGLFILAVPVAVQAQYRYFTNADGVSVTLTNYTGPGGIVIVPSSTNGLAVTCIGGGSFSVFGNSVSNVIIPGSVVAIADWAFQDCYNMTNVTIPNSVTSIGAGAFYECSALTNLTLPNGITSIDYETFYECSRLANVAIPESVASIGYQAFYECQNLGNVTIPSSVATIEQFAFFECGMTNLTIGDNGTSPNGGCGIGQAAFENCHGMSTVLIGSTVTSIGYQAFDDCNMTNLTIGTNGASPSGSCAIAEAAFQSCVGLNNVVIGSSVTSIGYIAFEGSGITNLMIGTNGTSPSGGCTIEQAAFVECHFFTNITIGSSVTSIGYQAFEDLNMTNTVTIGGNGSNSNGGCTIEEDAFQSCPMSSLIIGNNVTSIGYQAFGDCNRLTNATIGGGVIAEDAFQGCNVLEFLTLGNDVTSIGFEAFQGCSQLTNAMIGGGAIAGNAFQNCSGLTNVTLGPNVTSIGDYAFQDCYVLRSITIPNSVSSIGAYAFDDCYDLASVKIGNGISGISDYAFDDCYALTNVTFGRNVAAIGYQSFYFCTNLLALYFQGNAPSADSTAFTQATNANLTAYYYAGAIGWASKFDGITTVELSPNSLQIVLGPTEARDAGAQWQLDGGPAENASVTTLDNLEPGSHTVSFTPIAGWVTPSTQPVTITNGEEASIVGVYTPTNIPASGLILETNGYGTINHTGLPKLLVAGKKYTVKAVPDLNNVFAFWTGGTSQPYAVLSTSASYMFTMEPNLVLSANFVANPFTTFVGVYNGLFSATNGVTEQTAGMLKGLTIRTKGVYSGTLLINGGTHAMNGNFNSSGQATELISRPSSQGGPLRVDMTLLTSGDAALEVIGTVAGTNNGVPWLANNLVADLATNVLSSAEYTMLMLPDTNNTPPAGSPGGDGYALITNYSGTVKNPALAKIKVTGALADGTAFNQSVSVSQDGYVPLYSSLYGGKGLLLGWINLESTNAAGVGLTWIHPVSTTGLYKNGFTNILLANQFPLSLWTNPPPNLNALTELSTPDVINATNAANMTVTTTASGQINGTGVSGSIDPKTGLLKVTIGSGTSKMTGYGAVLLDTTNGGGYFVTKTNAQAIQLAP